MDAQVSIDVSAIGTFSSGSTVTIDGQTNAANGPSPAAVSPHSPISVDLDGYSVAFLELQ